MVVFDKCVNELMLLRTKWMRTHECSGHTDKIILFKLQVTTGVALQSHLRHKIDSKHELNMQRVGI